MGMGIAHAVLLCNHTLHMSLLKAFDKDNQ